MNKPGTLPGYLVTDVSSVISPPLKCEVKLFIPHKMTAPTVIICLSFVVYVPMCIYDCVNVCMDCELRDT